MDDYLILNFKVITPGKEVYCIDIEDGNFIVLHGNIEKAIISIDNSGEIITSYIINTLRGDLQYDEHIVFLTQELARKVMTTLNKAKEETNILPT